MYPSFVDPRHMTTYHCSVELPPEGVRAACHRYVQYIVTSEDKPSERIRDSSVDGVVNTINERVLGALDILMRHGVVSSQFVGQFRPITSGEVFFGLNKVQQRVELAQTAANRQLQQQQQLIERLRQQLLRQQEEEAQRQKQKQAEVSVMDMLQHLQEVQQQAQSQMLTLVTQNPQLWPQILYSLQCRQQQQQQPRQDSASFVSAATPAAACSNPKDQAVLSSITQLFRRTSYPPAAAAAAAAPVTPVPRVPSGTPHAPASETPPGISIATLCTPPPAAPAPAPAPASGAIIAHIPFPPAAMHMPPRFPPS